jgi:phage internal scaffolding protein
MSKMPHNPRRRVQLHFNDDTLTHQSFREQCDINKIVARYKKTGIVEHLSSSEPRYGDFLDATDYHDSLNKVITAQGMFNDLPSTVRHKFKNDPAQFLDFAMNPENQKEMEELGLLPPSPVEVVEAPKPDDAKDGEASKNL